MTLIRTENLTKKYQQHTALQDVSISVPTGSVFGLLGPNGAGKTSLIRIINQITAPDSGEVYFNEKKLHPDHTANIGYLPEERGLYRKMKVGEQALYLARLKGLSKTDAMKKLKFWFERFEIQTWWDKKVEELSKGMAQKVQFIITVLHEPELLILDEPFSGFDPINANLIKDELLRLNKAGTTIILSTHRMESVEELCSHIALINKSRKVLDGPISEVRNEFRNETYEVDYTGNGIGFANSLWTGFELISNVPHHGNHKAVVKLLNGNSTNNLLAALLPNCNINGFKEVIPSMNDVFIRAVNEGTPIENESVNE